MDAKTLTKKYANAENVRPEALAADLGISGKIVRGFLRQTFARPIEAKGTTWVLSAEQASATVAHFVSRRAPETKPNETPKG